MVRVVVVGVVSCVTIGNSVLPPVTFIQVTLGRGVWSEAIVTVHTREGRIDLLWKSQQK